MNGTKITNEVLEDIGEIKNYQDYQKYEDEVLNMNIKNFNFNHKLVQKLLNYDETCDNIVILFTALYYGTPNINELEYAYSHNKIDILYKSIIVNYQNCFDRHKLIEILFKIVHLFRALKIHNNNYDNNDCPKINEIVSNIHNIYVNEQVQDITYEVTRYISHGHCKVCKEILLQIILNNVFSICDYNILFDKVIENFILLFSRHKKIILSEEQDKLLVETLWIKHKKIALYGLIANNLQVHESIDTNLVVPKKSN